MKKKLLYVLIILLALAGTFFYLFVNNQNQYGHFEKISDMNVARVQPQLFLLKNGEVLVYGGNSEYSPEKYDLRFYQKGKTYPLLPIEVEIFNPISKTFILKKGARIIERFSNANAILLDNGKLLITGGCRYSHKKNNQNECVKSSQIYDPIKDQVIKGPDMNFPRYMHTAVKLNDGKVLIFGGKTGETGKNWINKTAEIYDPKLNKFILLKRLPNFIYERPANICLLKDGKVFIANTSVKNNIQAEIFDPQINKFKIIKICSTAVHENSSYFLAKVIALKNDKIVFFRNSSNEFFSNNIEIYDIKQQTIKNIGSMNIKNRIGYEVTLLADENILVTGGMSGGANFMRMLISSELFNTKKFNFYNTSEMNYKRYLFSTVLLHDGKVLITGGAYDFNHSPSSNSEIFNYKEK